MAYKCREEIVGKRFLSVSGFSKLKSGKISEWGWRSGVIRAATHRDNTNQDLQVLVEFDDVEWHRREWISIYKEGLFHLFLVEQALVWVQRRDPFAPTHGTVLWPALTFSALVSTVEIPAHLQPVEFLVDRDLAFKDYKLLKPYQEWDTSLPGVKDYPELRLAVKRWTELQDGQRILLTTPSVLVGYRVEVYRAEGTTQWYTAVIIGYNEATRDLTVTDDTVLEEHNEDPALVQMRLIGDGVVESIMRGENVGITPRRSRSSAFLHHQTSQAIHHHTRVIRGLSSVTCGVNPRKPRSARSGISETGIPPEPPDKGSSGKSRKRKPTEPDTTPTSKPRISNFSSTKEDCENKQTRRKNLTQRAPNKKKVLEEANNSKLREIEVRVEDCLQSNPALTELCRRNVEEKEDEEVRSTDAPDPRPIEHGLDDSNGSSVELVSVDVQSDDATVQCGSMPASEVVNGDLNGEEDCVIVAQRTSTPSKTEERDCSIRGDDDGPLVSSSPYSRMEFNSETPTGLLRFPDDRSDSGVSSLRSSSGDERSGSRSSALSSSDEPNHTSSSSGTSVPTIPTQNRSPLFIPAPSATAASAAQHQQRHDTEPVRVWRDPNLLLEEPHVRHIQSVQHQVGQTLLMSHPSTPASSGPSAPTSATGTHPATLGAYPVVPPPPSLMTPHPLGHPHLAAHSLYHPQFSDMMWKAQRGPYVPAHLLPQQTSHSTTEEMLERERAALVIQDRERHERMIRERHNQELEKQQKEKERLERDRQEQREKLERERERERQEKERQEQEQALHNHFEKSLRAAQQKREQWNPIAGRPPQSRTASLSEDDRKRVEELHQREQQQRHLTTVRADTRDHRSYYPAQRPQSVPGKSEYPPPPAHTRVVTSSKPSAEKLPPGMSVPQSIPKSELNIYGYPVCHPQNAFFEPKKSDMHKTAPSGLVVTKSGPMDREREISNQSLVSEIKNSVIVKHDGGKNPHHLEPRGSITHSPSPKLRNEMLSHYLPTPSQSAQAKAMYEYRSPTQSPHHLSHTPSPHHHLEPQNLGKAQSHHRPTGQLPSPHHQRQSPHQHPHSQPHQSPELRYPRGTEAQAMIYQTSGKASYPFTTAAYTIATTQSVSNSKPKVSSPAPHQIFGKPPLGGVSVVPVSRPHETSTPIQLTAKPPMTSVSPSPYQQVSQYHPPHNQSPAMMTCPPPPAHSSRLTSSVDRYDRTPGYAPGGLAVKLVGQQGTSPPTATSAPVPYKPPPQLIFDLRGISVQTKPLDLGVSSNKFENSCSVSPKRKASTPVSSASSGSNSNTVCLEIKKRRIEPPSTSAAVPPNLSIFNSQQQPQLARVSEPSPLIASAATTITTVVNTAAYRTPTTSVTSLISQNSMTLTENLPDVSVTAVTVETIRPPSTGEMSPKPATPTVPLSNSPTPVSAASTPTPPASVTPGPPTDESPGTPVKVNLTPSTVDSEKSNSPGPQKTSSSSYPVRHLKKAWLQRHTGEDLEDTTGVIGSGSCVTLPINIKTTTTTLSNSTSNSVKENPVNSIHSVGSMAVNSINKTKHFSSKPINRKPVKESTVNGDAKNDDSSSSDQERGRKSPPKRKPPKVKRKKGGGPTSKKPSDDKKRKTGTQPVTPPSESGSDSEKESGSEKDSDSGASASAPSKKTTSTGKEPRKRGRTPKGSKNDKGKEPRPKKIKDDIQPPRDPFFKPPVGQLRKTGESFLQDGPCCEETPKLAKCRECRPHQRSKKLSNIFCRFYAFRRLRYPKNGPLAIAGFSDPHKDALEDDLKLWLPSAENPPPDLDLETSRFLLKQVGDHFCDLLVQEKEAYAEHMSDDKTVAWKRVIQGVREMCDVCETTLFNFHWVCDKCGFVACIDCYKSRKKGTIKVWGEPGKDRDEYSWLLCTNRQMHEQEKLMLTQIIAGESLLKLGKMVHEMRELWNIEQYCGCATSKEVSVKSNNAQAKEIIKSILGDKVNGIKKEIKDEDGKSCNGIKEEKCSPLSWLADAPLDREEKKEGSSSEEEGNFSTLRELLIRPSHKPNGSRAASPVSKTENKKKTAIPTKPADLDDVISSVIEDNVPQKTVETPVEPKYELKHFVRRYNWQGKGRVQLPIRVMTLTESKMLYPETPHSWLCDGKLLRLSDPTCKGNQKIFQDQWKRGQPVIVSNVTRNINPELWNPDAFARDFGDVKNDLINCMTGNLVPNQPMRKFWEGFDHFSKRLKDDRGQPMLLKLKDWPPGEDFAEMLPTRYRDLMKVLPLSEYTHRTGRLNLASRLPDCFVRPDLGPKMYNAYGSALHPNKGTTNLHLDISDAVNVMMYVGIPKDGDSDEHIKEAFRAIDEAGCDILTRRRVRDKGELPGALWHIYNARDADKIRDLLNKVVVEKGGRLEPHHDPIHDQSCYLDGPLRERLYKEYGVEGYAIVQCKGDAVFIPAGAPHQVRNLHNCIKVAEDFVSPENVSHCFHLTQEFRDLSDTHSNHEDKLQIKNIIYHAVKDSLSALSAIMNKHLNVKSEKDSGSERSNGSASVDAENSTKSDSNETA